ncbi:MAG: 5-formyltetrahydrofolate cyclo-ligase [Rickettsiales bacterium]
MPDKNTLRSDMLFKRQALDIEFVREAAEHIADRLLREIPPGENVIAGYAAMRNEMDVFLAMQLLEKRGHTLCLPDVQDDEADGLVFRAWQSGQPLEKGKFGTDIPPAGETVVPDVVLVPLVAFDKKGHRLGYGAGYYDRALQLLRAANKELLVIGAGFSMQQVDDIPAEAHDETLDKVITEKAVIVPGI